MTIDLQQAKAAVELCIDLVFHAPYPIARHPELNRAIQFLQAIHTQVEADIAAAEASPVSEAVPAPTVEVAGE